MEYQRSWKGLVEKKPLSPNPTTPMFQCITLTNTPHGCRAEKLIPNFVSLLTEKKYENENYNLLPCFEIFLFLTYAKISKQTGKGNTQNKITKLEHTGPAQWKRPLRLQCKEREPMSVQTCEEFLFNTTTPNKKQKYSPAWGIHYEALSGLNDTRMKHKNLNRRPTPQVGSNRQKLFHKWVLPFTD